MSRITRDQLAINIKQAINAAISYFTDDDPVKQFSQLRLFPKFYEAYLKSEKITVSEEDESANSVIELLAYLEKFSRTPTQFPGFTKEILEKREHQFGILFMRYVMLLGIYELLSTVVLPSAKSEDKANEAFNALSIWIEQNILNIFKEFDELFVRPSSHTLNISWFYFFEEYAIQGLKHGTACQKIVLEDFRQKVQCYFNVFSVSICANKNPQALRIFIQNFRRVIETLQVLYPVLQDNDTESLMVEKLCQLVLSSIHFPQEIKTLSDLSTCYAENDKIFRVILNQFETRRYKLTLPVIAKIFKCQEDLERIYRNPLEGRPHDWLLRGYIEESRHFFVEHKRLLIPMCIALECLPFLLARAQYISLFFLLAMPFLSCVIVFPLLTLLPQYLWGISLYFSSPPEKLSDWFYTQQHQCLVDLLNSPDCDAEKIPLLTSESIRELLALENITVESLLKTPSDKLSVILSPPMRDLLKRGIFSFPKLAGFSVKKLKAIAEPKVAGALGRQAFFVALDNPNESQLPAFLNTLQAGGRSDS